MLRAVSSRLLNAPQAFSRLIQRMSRRCSSAQSLQRGFSTSSWSVIGSHPVCSTMMYSKFAVVGAEGVMVWHALLTGHAETAHTYLLDRHFVSEAVLAT